MLHFQNLRNQWRSFQEDRTGGATIEFVLCLPLFVFLFTIAFEAGLMSTRQVMLEHGMTQTVRNIRIGAIRNIDGQTLIQEICEQATIIPDCTNQVRIEMIPISIDQWDTSLITGEAQCRNRDEDDSEALLQPVFTGNNNDMMFLRACALIDPMLPDIGIGKRMGDSEGGPYKLVTSTAYVLEPFQ